MEDRFEGLPMRTTVSQLLLHPESPLQVRQQLPHEREVLLRIFRTADSAECSNVHGHGPVLQNRRSDASRPAERPAKIRVPLAAKELLTRAHLLARANASRAQQRSCALYPHISMDVIFLVCAALRVVEPERNLDGPLTILRVGEV